MYSTDLLRKLMSLSLFLFALLALGSPPFSAANSHKSELHAAMIYRLANFVEWNDGATSAGPLRVAVVGARDVAEELQKLSQTRKLAGRAFEVQQVDGLDRDSDFDLCFVGAEMEESVDALLAERKPNLLTISNATGFARRGGMIQLITVGGRTVKFEVNRAASVQAGLRISSLLLELAVAVHDTAGEN